MQGLFVDFTYTWNDQDFAGSPFELCKSGGDDDGQPMWQVIGMTEAQAEEIRDECIWKAVRVKRDELLAATDWWASSDLTMSAERTAYRQALRDITTQSDPQNITWPEKPE